ncbi:hypothetical protein COV20_00445 [Candidatus Woesearchaeota archaeon CG10_big_fil_rev_8_21_14_0_10_45_16]|nr:MAG: hypothetical protein COV20_00445 [Candidatus Woesearchaeota archaeon CG10_big_fil_rev_8_21_14_0_10_45_16]
MRKIIALLLLSILVLQVAFVGASAADAKQDWKDAKMTSQEKQKIHQDAKITFAADKSEENRQAVVDTGKDLLNAVLDEAEAWLMWKDAEADENNDIPEDLRDTIKEDVKTNLGKVDGLRVDVDGVDNELELGLVFLKMIGKYGELLTDVARDSGKVMVFIGNTQLDKADDLEARLRDSTDREDVLTVLDTAHESLDEARNNVDKAEKSYDQVVLPGTPMIKFGEGNNYLRVAKTNLLSAQANLQKAYLMIIRGE